MVTSSVTSATRKLLRRSRSRLSANTVPGVTVSVTSRRTIPLASAGFSTWSQIATRRPMATSFERYSSSAFAGVSQATWITSC